ncbi:Flotillin-like protein, partial [Thalictrum thalictroides]
FKLWIYNANIKQLVDVPGHEYFSYLSRKIQQEAANQAKIDISEAKMKGDIGAAKQREGLTAQNVTKIDKETRNISIRRKQEVDKEEKRIKVELEVDLN